MQKRYSKLYQCYFKLGQKKKYSWPQIYFFNRSSGNILFSSSVSFSFFWNLVFFCFWFFWLFVCFLKLKIYILIHIRLCGRVSDKKIFTRPISGNKATFFGPIFCRIQVGKSRSRSTHLQLYQKRDSCTGVFLWVLRSF